MHCAVSCDERGLTRTLVADDGSESTVTIQWRDVTSVTAFKRDLFAYDLICFALTTRAVEFEIDEEMDGWQSLVDALPTYIPGFPNEAEWWAKIAQPPFATNPQPALRMCPIP